MKGDLGEELGGSHGSTGGGPNGPRKRANPSKQGLQQEQNKEEAKGKESNRLYQSVTKEGIRRGRSDKRVTEEEIARLQAIFTEKVTIPKEEIREAREQWRLALVGRFLGKRMDSNYIARKLGEQWNTAGDVDIIPWAGGYYIFKISVGGGYASCIDWRPVDSRESSAIIAKA